MLFSVPFLTCKPHPSNPTQNRCTSFKTISITRRVAIVPEFLLLRAQVQGATNGSQDRSFSGGETDLDSEFFVDGYEHRELAAALATFSQSGRGVFGLNLPVNAAEPPAVDVPIDRNAGPIMQFMLYGGNPTSVRNPASVRPPSAHFFYLSGSTNGRSSRRSSYISRSQ